MRLATLELHKEFMKFSAGHFTVFSATHRENLHGHNFRVFAALTMPVGDNVMTVNYNYYKKKLKALCQSLNNFFLIPTQSPHLVIHEEADAWCVHFAEERMRFLKRDVLCLPLRNITVEELSFWFVEQLLSDQHDMSEHQVQRISIKVYTGPGQAGRTDWTRSEGYELMPV